MKKIAIPAVTRELDFIANHTEEADDIWDGNVKIDPLLKSLSDTVYKRAEEDACALLESLKDCMQGSSDGLRINNWHRPRESWEVYSDIFSGAKGRKKKIGWAGLHIGNGKVGFRLIGFMGPRIGGLDGRRKLAAACKKKMKEVTIRRETQ